MRTFFIGSSPPNEEPAQVKQPNYREQATKECNALIGQIRRQFGSEPLGSRIEVQENVHEFGPYYEVVILCDDTGSDGVQYAVQVEECLEGRWDRIAKRELGIPDPESN